MRRVNGELGGIGPSAAGSPSAPVNAVELWSCLPLSTRPTDVRATTQSGEVVSSTVFRCGDVRQSISSSANLCGEVYGQSSPSLRPSLAQAWRTLSGSSDYPVRDHRRRRVPLVHRHLMLRPQNQTLVHFDALAAKIEHTYPNYYASTVHRKYRQRVSAVISGCQASTA